MLSVPSIYGFLIALAVLICILLAEKKASLYGVKKVEVWDYALTALVSGIIGARLYHVIHFWSFYSEDFSRILNFSAGGLGILGGLLAAATAIVVWALLRKQNFWVWLDLFASVTPLGQALGRWGNFFNQENFGQPTLSFLGIYISPQNRPAQFSSFNRFHPLFFYEFVLDLTLFFTLAKLEKRFPLGQGYIFAFYVLGYSIIRFFLEFLRIEPWKIGIINTAQGICVTATVAALLFLNLKRRSTIK